MGVGIRYMGAKHALASTVACVVEKLPRGPCLDLFSGMCSVAGALAPKKRPSWCNDIQEYATVVAEAVTTSHASPPTPERVATALKRCYSLNLQVLQDRYFEDLQAEEEALQHDDHEKLGGLADNWKHVGNSEHLKSRLSDYRNSYPKMPFSLFTLTFSHGYFGLRQSIEIDSCRYAIYRAKQDGALNYEEARWCLVALLQVASHITTSPGHFAQYLAIKKSTFNRIKRQRSRNVWQELLRQLASISPYGQASWRQNNKVMSQDALELLTELRESSVQPAVVYADPPYSRAQYSRYYHVLETLVKYDYPHVAGKGRYRPDRFRTPFSHLSRVHDSFHALVQRTKDIGASLVISYPSNGRLYEAGHDLFNLVRSYYESVDVMAIDYTHSTMGGAHGHAAAEVTEQIFVATQPT